MSPPSASHVVTVGETMLRITPDAGSRLEAASGARLTAGGAESNVAVALASLGVPTSWIGALPLNPLGKNVARMLAAAGVNLEHVHWSDGSRLGLYFVELPAPPRPASVCYDRAGSAMSAMTPSEFNAHALDHAAYVVTSGILSALGDNSADLTRMVIDEATKRGVSVCFDLNYRARLWSPKEASAGLRPYLAASQIVVSSSHDAELLYAVTGSDEARVTALRDRVAPEAEIVVMTLGERG